LSFALISTYFMI